MKVREYIRNVRKGSCEATYGLFDSSSSAFHSDSLNSLEAMISRSRKQFNRGPLLQEIKNDQLNENLVGQTLINVLERIRAGAPIITVSHQPTLFPYSGVYNQFTLADVLVDQHRVSDRRLTPVVVYLCLDSDDVCDRQIRGCKFPSPLSKKGFVSITSSINGREKGCIQRHFRPTNEEEISKWSKIIDGLYGHMIRENKDAKPIFIKQAGRIQTYFEYLNNLFKCSKVKNYAESNSAILLDFVRRNIRKDIVTVKSSKLFKSNKNYIVTILNQWDSIEQEAKVWGSKLKKYGVSTNVASKLDMVCWCVCPKCGKRKTLNVNQSRLILETGSRNMYCQRCEKSFTAIELHPRVIIEDLMGFMATDASLVLTYSGGAEHTFLSDFLIRKVFACKSPMYSWHPKQLYDSGLLYSIFNEHQTVLTNGQLYALSLLANGRDSLLCSIGDGFETNLRDLWRKHFLTHNLSDRAVSSPHVANLVAKLDLICHNKDWN